MRNFQKISLKIEFIENYPKSILSPKGTMILRVKMYRSGIQYLLESSQYFALGS